ncbi:thioredoxin family protein [Burkholderia sp. L27(2015)]|uniref:thioredoxin family protein n=1 Tax=Burkholderia sp. L27(2015) TaxID=1641858 RepID=UPI00131CDD8E|nr:thioredoxin family protein [Burkholderia sp. L27(2015)]
MKAGIIKYVSGVVLGVCFTALTSGAWAAEVPFNKAQFDQDVAAGKPTIVYLHATWCPTCKIQTPIVERLSTDPKLKSVTIFLADYDTEVALKKSLKVTQQSTFVVFKQGHEVTRSTGQTQEQAIRATFEQAL